MTGNLWQPTRRLFLIAFLATLTPDFSQTNSAWAQTNSSETSPSSTLSTAVDWSHRTGAPMLVIAGRESCPACKVLKQQIQTEPVTRQILASCITVYIDCDSSEYQQWVAQHQPTSDQLPQWFLIRSDGLELINQTGGMASNSLNELLISRIRLAGKPLLESEIQDVQTLVDQLQALLSTDQNIEAVKLVADSQTTLRMARKSFNAASNSLRGQLVRLQTAMVNEIEQAQQTLRLPVELNQPSSWPQLTEPELQRIRDIISVLQGVPKFSKALAQLESDLAEYERKRLNDD